MRGDIHGPCNPVFLSGFNLIKQMKKQVLEGAHILSESTVIHSFAPQNIEKKTTQYYTGRINFKRAIQRRQLRDFHTHWHCCLTLY